LADFEAAFPHGAPSLVHCESLKVIGKKTFPANLVLRGKIEFTGE
jgi:hypothetical protein